MARKHPRVKPANWLLPLLFALPVLAGAAAALLLWGDKIRELFSIAVKLAVIS
ncbi:MAG: hypothetical protein J6M20_13015 [Clostridia bacterium]|nr:hypothetical protein [Clostridia bacterium]MBQ8313212.1 hypothetical protein [Clostridia bacterium]